MKKLFIPFLIVALTTAISCSRMEDRQAAVDGSASADSLRQVLLSEVNRYYSDMSARNWEAYADHFWPGAHLMTVWQPPGADSLQVVMTTIEEFVQQADQGPGSQPIFEEKLLDAEINVYNNLAAVWASYAAKFGTKDSLMEWKGVDAFTYLKHDGEWRISSISYTNMGE